RVSDRVSDRASDRARSCERLRDHVVTRAWRRRRNMSANDGPLNWSGDDERRADPSSETQDDREVDVTARELKPALERATTTLRTALDEACRTNFERANTGELIRVEEVLAIANEAAKEVISVRQRLRGERRRP